MAIGDRILGVDSTTSLFAPSVQAVQDARTLAIAQSAIPPTNASQALMIGDGSPTVPIRPNTNLPVIFNTTTFVPTNGTRTGGTPALVLGLDFWTGAGGSGGGGGTSLIVMESPWGSGTYSNRPPSSSMVTWKGVVAPATGGTTSGGTPQMVDNLDEFLQYSA
jgi:hypothetical protein